MLERSWLVYSLEYALNIRIRMIQQSHQLTQLIQSMNIDRLSMVQFEVVYVLTTIAAMTVIPIQRLFRGQA